MGCVHGVCLFISLFQEDGIAFDQLCPSVVACGDCGGDNARFTVRDGIGSGPNGRGSGLLFKKPRFGSGERAA